MIKFLSLEIKNLFSFSEAAISLENEGIVLVTGFSEDEKDSNGSGKSSLTSKAIVWTLYGQTPQKLRADQVCNRHLPNSKTSAKLVFSRGSDLFTITRTRNPSGLKLEKNGEDVSLNSVAATQSVINTILSVDYDTFVHANFFGQGRPQSFCLLSPSEQMSIISNLLPIDVLDKLHIVAKDKVFVLKYELLSKEKQILFIRGELAQITNSRDRIEDQERNWFLKNTERTEELMKLKYKLESSKEFNNLDKLKAELADLIKLRDAYPAHREDYHRANLAVSQINANLWNNTMLSVKLNNEQSTLIKQLESDTCITCNQPLPQLERDKTKEEIDIKLKRLETQILFCHSYHKAHEIMKKKYNEHREYLKNLFEDIGELNSQIDKLNSQIKELDIDISSKINSIDVELQLLKDAPNPYKDSYNQLTANYITYSKTLEWHKELQAELENKISSYDFWVKAFKQDLYLLLLSSAVNLLNFRTAQHLIGLQNPQIHVEFSLKKETKDEDRDLFNVKVWSDTGGSSFLSLSGGEQQIVSFAIGLAIADLAESRTTNPLPILILDEPFTMLAPKNCEALTSYLSETLLKTKQTIFLVSNDVALMSLIPNQIKVVKKNGISTLAEDPCQMNLFQQTDL